MSGKLQAILWLITAAMIYMSLWQALRIAAGAVRWRRIADVPILAVGVLLVVGLIRAFAHSAMPGCLMPGLLLGMIWFGVQGRIQLRAQSHWQERKRAKEDSRHAILHLVLITGSLVFLFPFLWLVSTSFKVEEKMFTQPPELIPRRYLSLYIDGSPHRLAKMPIDGKLTPVALLSTAGDKAEVHTIAASGATLRAPKAQVDQQGDLEIAVDGEERPLATITIPNKQLGDQKLSGLLMGEQDGLCELRLATVDPKARMVSSASVTPIQQVYFQWRNYPKALQFLPEETGHGLVFLRNTLYLCLMNILGTVLSASLTAYGFARLRWPGRDFLFVVLLATMMLPGAVTMIPVFLIFRTLGWVDTLRPLWVPAFFGGAFNIFLLRQFFLTIPNDLEDAAKIDGCSYFGIYWRIMLPLVKPALATITIFAFMGSWNNFMGPLIYVNSPSQMPLAYALQLFQSSHGSEYGLQMAASTLVVLPVLMVFFFTQRYFIQGITLTGIKG